MKDESLAFLRGDLRYLGFERRVYLSEQLDKELATDHKEFRLTAETFFDEDHRLELTLHFRRSDNLEMCFLNKYEARLDPGKEPDKERFQTFYVNKGKGVTLKEAYNLLQGRAVNKDLTNAEGQKYNAWIQLNFEEKDGTGNYKVRQYRQQYGYDLEKTLEKYPILELNNEELKANLLRSLKRGNMHPVSFGKIAKVEKMLIEANPQFKTINIHPTGVKIVRRESGLFKEGEGEGLFKEGEREGKEIKEEDPELPAVRKTMKKTVIK